MILVILHYILTLTHLVHLSMLECQHISVNCMLAGWTHTQAPTHVHRAPLVHTHVTLDSAAREMHDFHHMA